MRVRLSLTVRKKIRVANVKQFDQIGASNRLFLGAGVVNHKRVPVHIHVAARQGAEVQMAAWTSMR